MMSRSGGECANHSFICPLTDSQVLRLGEGGSCSFGVSLFRQCFQGTFNLFSMLIQYFFSCMLCECCASPGVSDLYY